MPAIHIVNVQYALDKTGLPDDEKLTLWANAALENVEPLAELSIRIVDEVEGAQLNEKWSEKSGPTNVLSFPLDVAKEVEPRLLGDIVICAPLISREATEQGKLEDAHWAHMVVHGTLHLLGYDHIERSEMKIMESLEIEILDKLNINNPYV